MRFHLLRLLRRLLSFLPGNAQAPQARPHASHHRTERAMALLEAEARRLARLSEQELHDEFMAQYGRAERVIIRDHRMPHWNGKIVPGPPWDIESPEGTFRFNPAGYYEGLCDEPNSAAPYMELPLTTFTPPASDEPS